MISSNKILALYEKIHSKDVTGIRNKKFYKWQLGLPNWVIIHSALIGACGYYQ